MLISAVVRSSPVSSGNPNLDETLNDISIGAFASALVAFLILLKDIQTEISKKVFKKVYDISFFGNSCRLYAGFLSVLQQSSRN